ncbi:hypothetical protein O181_012396 [Austropuccinia psidii MF-1]|uniref:SH3 domain-containing protein n=1 Tax=Austropuccinia psidii MF-1 TaxID=1389203 RepID=A0A9Q3BUK3_9BASI|nr:hypothetical protein [Austropuccinia psidii MF-1]
MIKMKFIKILFLFLKIISKSSSSSSATNDNPEALNNLSHLIDWSSLGQVALFGSFSSLTIFNSTDFQQDQKIKSSNSSILFSHSIKSLLSKNSSSSSSSSSKSSSNSNSNLPQILTTTNPNGRILTICSTSNKIFIGGQFDSLSSIPNTNNIGYFDLSSNSIKPLSTSINLFGTIHSLTCSNDNQIFIGGEFSNPLNNNSNNLIAWSTSSGYQSISNSSPLIFNGPIYSLNHLISPSGQSLILGGRFAIPTSINPQSLNLINNLTSDPHSTFSLSTSLNPIPLSHQATWSGSPASLSHDYQSPNVLYCPSGPDGPKNSWEINPAFDNGMLTLTLGTSVNAGGIRIANSFTNGGGTAGFHIISLPNNQILNLTFLNPVTKQIDSCQTNCTLSRDLKIGYQDFLFPLNTIITGIQFIINSKYGNSAGLHLVQLLSPGNIAYAVQNLNHPNNGSFCNTGIGAFVNPINVSTTGSWKSISVPTNLPGTIQPILFTSIPSGTTPDNGPSLTWSMSVPRSGNYNLLLQIPGCSNLGDCSTRSTLSVTISCPGINSKTITIDNHNHNLDNQSLNIFNGTLPIGPGLTVTIKLANPIDQSSSGSIAIDQLILQAHSSSLSTNFGTPANGLYELILTGNGAFGDGSISQDSTNSNDSLSTAIDQLGVTLKPDSIVRTISNDNQIIFVGGDQLSVFNGPSAIATNNLTVPNGGLNGSIRALTTKDGALYVGGNFQTTSDGSLNNLNGLARWKYSTPNSKWEALIKPNTDVISNSVETLQFVNELLLVGGSSIHGQRRALGIFDTQIGDWVKSTLGVYFGNLTKVITSSPDSQMIYLAGNVDAVGAISAPSAAILSNDQSGNPNLSGLNFQTNETATQLETNQFSAMTSNLLGSSISPSQSHLKTQDLSLIISNHHLLKRRQSIDMNSPNVSLPNSLTDTASSTILTGAFWKSNQLVIGGRFVSTDSVSNIGIYDLDNSILRPLNGDKLLQGSVLTIKIVGDLAWIGGLFVSPSGKIGLDTYNLTSGQWATRAMAGVVGYNNTNVSVRVIKSKFTGDVLVGGKFQQVGQLSCQSICLWSAKDNQWMNLGSGLKGLVNGIEVMGKTQDLVLAIGKFELNQTIPDASIATWNFNSQQPLWTPIGSQELIPGSIESIVLGELDQGVSDGMFIAGERSDGRGSFLMMWKNNDWSSVVGIDSSSQIEHVAFVPIRNPSTTINFQNGIKSDRMLMVSGLITLSGGKLTEKFGSVLYDGKKWYPYLTSLDSKGQAGILSRIVTRADGFRSTLRHIHSVAIVILISMAISFGIVFLGVLTGVLIGLKKKSSEKKKTLYPIGGMMTGIEDEEEDDTDGQRAMADEMSERQARRPISLLATIDAATAAMAERMHMRNDQGDVDLRKEDESIDDQAISGGMEKMAVGSFGSNKLRSDQAENILEDYIEVDEDLGEDIDVRRARWSFEPQLPGEIAVGAGESVEVRDRSNQEWWLVRRADGVEGVVPADWFL